jgi:hypothetical protein
MALIVEQGITRDALQGSVTAWRFLASNNVPEDVILRVLAEPSRRRSSDISASRHTTRATACNG